MTNQKVTSANTSINKNKLPAAYQLNATLANLNGADVLDYGCGKYIEHIRKHVIDNGAASYHAYDPFNQPSNINRDSIAYGTAYGYDVIMCCNVLNVINSNTMIDNTIRNMINMLAYGGIIIIQIYEGNKSGIGKITKADCYQRNEKAENYFEYVLNAVNGLVNGDNFTVNRYSNIITICYRPENSERTLQSYLK